MSEEEREFLRCYEEPVTINEYVEAVLAVMEQAVTAAKGE